MRTFILLLLLALPDADAQRLTSIPDRNPFSLTGSQLVPVLSPMTREAREERIFQEILQGNIPAFLRQLVPLTYSIAGKSITIYVTPDYMALGSDDDYFLMPMGGPLAQRVANLLGCSMPTRPLVDRIYQAAALKMAPQPISPTAEMITIPVFWQHRDLVWPVRHADLAAYPLGTLVGGHKKDVILSHKIYEELRSTVPKPVVIYGWHQLNGQPIQPVYNGHVEWYADYSHGIRLIADTVLVDSVVYSYRSLLSDASLFTLVSETKAMAKPYYTSPTGVEAGTPEDHGFDLQQNYPNPFNPETTIGWSMMDEGRVKVSVLDMLGREVAVLVDGTLPGGSHSVAWNASGMASGLYVCRLLLEGGGGRARMASRRMLLVR